MELPPQSTSSTPGAAATAITPDPATAALLEKHAAWKSGTGERPTPQELGKLGSFAKWLRNPLGKNGVPPGPAQPGQPIRNAAAMGATTTAQTPGGGLAPIEVDPGLAQRTTAAVLNRADAFAVSYIEREAIAAGATGETLDRFRSAAGLSVADKKLLVEISPDVFQELGIDPRRCAIYTAIGVLGFHSWNLYGCVRELREMQKERATINVQATSTPAPAAVPAAAPKPALTPEAAGMPSPMAAPAGAKAPNNLPARGAGPIATLKN